MRAISSDISLAGIHAEAGRFNLTTDVSQILRPLQGGRKFHVTSSPGRLASVIDGLQTTDAGDEGVLGELRRQAVRLGALENALAKPVEIIDDEDKVHAVRLAANALQFTFPQLFLSDQVDYLSIADDMIDSLPKPAGVDASKEAWSVYCHMINAYAETVPSSWRSILVTGARVMAETCGKKLKPIGYEAFRKYPEFKHVRRVAASFVLDKEKLAAALEEASSVLRPVFLKIMDQIEEPLTLWDLMKSDDDFFVVAKQAMSMARDAAYFGFMTGKPVALDAALPEFFIELMVRVTCLKTMHQWSPEGSYRQELVEIFRKAYFALTSGASPQQRAIILDCVSEHCPLDTEGSDYAYAHAYEVTPSEFSLLRDMMRRFRRGNALTAVEYAWAAQFYSELVMKHSRYKSESDFLDWERACLDALRSLAGQATERPL